jgi:hypothetical protein
MPKTSRTFDGGVGQIGNVEVDLAHRALISEEVAFAARPSVSNALVSSDLTLRALTGLLARDSLKNPCGSRIRACALADPERPSTGSDRFSPPGSRPCPRSGDGRSAPLSGSARFRHPKDRRNSCNPCCIRARARSRTKNTALPHRGPQVRGERPVFRSHPTGTQACWVRRHVRLCGGP